MASGLRIDSLHTQHAGYDSPAFASIVNQGTTPTLRNHGQVECRRLPTGFIFGLFGKKKEPWRDGRRTPSRLWGMEEPTYNVWGKPPSSALRKYSTDEPFGCRADVSGGIAAQIFAKNKVPDTVHARLMYGTVEVKDPKWAREPANYDVEVARMMHNSVGEAGVVVAVAGPPLPLHPRWRSRTGSQQTSHEFLFGSSVSQAACGPGSCSLLQCDGVGFL
eukprot:gnl/TRDRNA2_/TRDRNA2_42859_c0_seq1.p1 gnl/TRDRNA2_/TRDRNA2_42859_c0~~gnl/TRDRNA2_/TRDRNA2_42859_c0_seq1.p1  ORF type:complete len:219 (-),score=19.71 gnl/TRDRNA2_/TRDRNA2_42859_c0_seq1:94-750(-)